MTTKETNTEENTDVVQKSADETSLITLVAELVRKQDTRIDNQEETFGKRFEALETLIKEANKNPVDSGVEAENKPKTEDAKDVGDKVTAGNDVAPKPSDSQASIIAPAVEDSKTDTSGLKMENKAEDEDEKKDEKKEDVEKTDEDEKKDEKKEYAKEVTKSDDGTEYEIIKTVRPILKTNQVEATAIPTGYQVLKAIISGFNGKTSSVEESLTIAYNKLEAGEFGTGLPTGGYV